MNVFARRHNVIVGISELAFRRDFILVIINDAQNVSVGTFRSNQVRAAVKDKSVVGGVNPKVLGGLSIVIVILWLLLGFIATDLAMQYANYITFIGGLAIFLLGFKSVFDAIKHIRETKGSA